jgi:hypothetical protein
MLKPWHIKALWFKAALQDVLLEGQKSLTAVQWQQMCSMSEHPRSCARSPHAASPCEPVTTAAGTSAATTSSSNKATRRPGCGAMRSGGRWQTVRATALHLRLRSITLGLGLFIAPFLVARKDCELFIKWKGDAGGLNHIRGEKVRRPAAAALRESHVTQKLS